jgi:hypothetical protein
MNSNNKAQRPSSSKNNTNTYKFDSTKAILDGLVLTPNFHGVDHKNTPFAFDNNNNIHSEADFHPPVPRSTATLLSMAEEKIKSMSSSSSRPGGAGNRRKELGHGVGPNNTSQHKPKRPMDKSGSGKVIYICIQIFNDVINKKTCYDKM